MKTNIDKTEFYPQWSYSKRADGFVRLFFPFDGEMEYNDFSLKRMVGILRNNFGHKLPKITVQECSPLLEIYPSLRPYAVAITQKLPGPIARLCVCAAKNGDRDIVEYVFARYGISKQDFEDRTVSEFTEIEFREKRKEVYVYEASCALWQRKRLIYFDNLLNAYAIADDCDYKKKIIFLSSSADKQFKEKQVQTERTLNGALSEADGFWRIDFNGKAVCVKKEDNEKYYTLDFYNHTEYGYDVAARKCTVEQILALFDARGTVNSAIKVGAFPLCAYARKTNDKYLLCELRYLAGSATNDEILYAESVVKRNRFIARQKTYCVSDAQIFGVRAGVRKIASKPHRWIGYRSRYAFELPEYQFELNINGLPCVAVWCICNMFKLKVFADGRYIYLDITEDLMLELAKAANFKGISA